MMYRLGLLVMLLGMAAQAFTPVANEKLGGVMRAMMKDVTTVAFPTTKPNPTTVADDDVMNALIRTRTATYLLQSAIDKMGYVQPDGTFKSDELTPGGLDQTTPTEMKTLTAQYTDLVNQAMAKLATAETQLQAQLDLPAAKRSFVALKATMDDLSKVMMAAHQMFRPPQQPSASISFLMKSGQGIPDRFFIFRP